MVLVSTINIDLGTQTAILTCSSNGNSVDVITYDNSVQEVTFDSRDGIIIDFSEFLSFCDQINIFETAILFNFNSNVFATTPFSQMIANELHDPGMWNLTISAHTDPNVYECQGTKSSQKMDIMPRAGSKTLTFPEWLYFLQALNHYRLSIKGF